MTAVLCRELGIETESCPFPEYAEKLVQESAFDLVLPIYRCPEWMGSRCCDGFGPFVRSCRW